MSVGFKCAAYRRNRGRRLTRGCIAFGEGFDVGDMGGVGLYAFHCQRRTGGDARGDGACLLYRGDSVAFAAEVDVDEHIEAGAGFG